MKKKGTSTCIACPFKVKDDVYHFQKFQRHLKSSNHPMEQAWYCKNYNCKKRSFKLGGLRTCSEKRPYFRLEDQNDHQVRRKFCGERTILPRPYFGLEDHNYHVSESESSLQEVQEVNKISSSIREVNCALDRLIQKYSFKIEVKEDIKKEMLDTAKIMVKKVEKINEHVSYIGKVGDSDTICSPSQSDSKNNDVEIILGL